LECSSSTCRLHATSDGQLLSLTTAASLQNCLPDRPTHPHPHPQPLTNAPKQESTLAVELVSESQRSGGGGALLYDYEYELNSTRGRKRILNTVSITGADGALGVGCGVGWAALNVGCCVKHTTQTFVNSVVC